MKLRRSTLARRLQTMPMLKALVPFAAGILLAARFELPAGFVVAAIALCGSAAILLHHQLAFVGLLAAAGYGFTLLHPTRPDVPLGQPLLLTLRVTDAGRRAAGVVERWCDPATGRWYSARTAVLLGGDSLLQPQTGERLCGFGPIRPIRGGSAGYRRLMRSRGYAGMLYLRGGEVLAREAPLRRPFHERVAARLERRIATTAQGPDTLRQEAAAVVRAMTIGDRRTLSAPLRERYARSGMAHLLAVSGLHTGIVFLLTHLLFRWLGLFRWHRLRSLLPIGAVWLFAAATGFPPGVLRAAMMCTLLQLTVFTTSPHQPLNGWALTALLLLALRPAWLFDISFQLSFVAVAAILAWGLPLARRCRTGRYHLDRLLRPLIIGLTASAATAPLVSYTFGIVPLAGVLLNPLVVLTGTLIVTGGLLLLLCPPLSGVLLPATLWTAAQQNRLAAWVGSLDGAYLEQPLSARGTVLCYLLFALATLIAWAAEPTEKPTLPA